MCIRDRFWKCDQWQKVLRLLPEHYEEDLNHQVLDECQHALRCPASGRYMRNRTVMAGSFALSLSVKKICQGHGARDHQPIKGYLEPGLSRSDYVRENHSSLARELAKDLLGGLHLQKPGQKLRADAGKRRQRKVRLAVAKVATGEGSDTDPEMPEAASDSDADEVLSEEAHEPKEVLAAKKGMPAPKFDPVGKTTCQGCLDKSGKTLHTKGPGCRLTRHAEAMKRWQAKDKDKKRTAHGSALKKAAGAVAAAASAGAAVIAQDASESSKDYWGPPPASASAAAGLPMKEGTKDEDEDEHEGAFGRLRSLKNVGGVIDDREGDPGTSSSSTAVPKAAKAKGEMTGVLPDLEDIPNILPRGGLLRALMKGGPPAIKAAKEVHRRWDHMPLGEMQVLFKRANLDPSLIAELKKICLLYTSDAADE